MYSSNSKNDHSVIVSEVMKCHLHSTFLGHLYDGLLVEVAEVGGCWTDVVGLICLQRSTHNTHNSTTLLG